MFTSRRRTAAGAAALVLTALVLTACSGNGDGGRANTSAPAPVAASASASASAPPSAPAFVTVSATASGGSTTPGSTPAAGSTVAPTGAARWAGTKQFVQIRSAWISKGRTYLSVRAARKVAATGPIEAWEIVPGQGPYVTVPMAADGRVLLSVPLGDNSSAQSYSQAEFVRRLTAESPSHRTGLGYDLSFDANGQVARLQSLYTS